jgi:hypothetical protein
VRNTIQLTVPLCTFQTDYNRILQLTFIQNCMNIQTQVNAKHPGRAPNCYVLPMTETQRLQNKT